MKYLIALLIIMFIAMVGISATLIVINLSLNWALESSNRTLDKCEEKVIQCNNLETVKENKEEAIEYQENLDPIDIYSEEEFLIEFPIEFVNLEPSPFYILEEEIKICVEWKYYAWGNDVCQKWVNSL